MKSRTLKFAVGIVLLAAPVRLAAQQHHHYKLIDIGTFGGPTSQVHEGAQVISKNETVVGGADTSTPDPNFNPNFPSSCLLCQSPFITHAFQWQGGVQTDLGALPGVNSSFAVWTSNSGWTVGYSENGATDPFLGIPEVRAVLWKDGQIVDLGTLDGSHESVAFAVNSRGQVAGLSGTRPDPFNPLGHQRPFLWENGVMHDLGTLGGPDAGLLGIEGNIEMNERCHVIGCSSTSTVNPATGSPTVDPFLWEPDTMIDLGSLGGTSGCAIFLNNSDQVVGYSNLAGDMSWHPFTWGRGQPLTDLGSLGGPTGIAFWVNESGEVVGNSDLPGVPGCNSPNVFHGFVWKDGSMTDIGALAGTDCSTAASINSKTQIVGASFTLDFSVANAILWENGSLVDLNLLIAPGSALHLFKGVDINERGEIAGSGGLSNGDIHAFLLIPCDENHPGVEGCDYSLVDASAIATGSAMPTTTTVKPELSPDAIRQLMQAAGRRSKPWYRGFGVQTLPK